VIYGAFATLPIFLLWIYVSWLVVLMGATVASLMPALRLHRWTLQRRAGEQIADALRILNILGRARSSRPPGRSLTFMARHLRVHPDLLNDILAALRELGYVVPTPEGEHWVLACDPSSTDTGALTDRLLIDRAQPGLTPAIASALADTLNGTPPMLQTLFDADASSPPGG
ncbi:MAG TPA: hypothetical protein VHK04_05955, partial [Castellaniella sp.]|nr:hypothetical protein [Castellaniella sp.]